MAMIHFPADYFSGLMMQPDDIEAIFSAPYLHQSLATSPKSKKQNPASLYTKDGFQVSLDVQHFQPEEISVKTLKKSIIVEGKHEEKEDAHGFITRIFTRRYELPENYDLEKVQSYLSSDGVLTLKAPSPKEGIEQEAEKERIVPVAVTGPVREAIKKDMCNKECNVEQIDGDMKECKCIDPCKCTKSSKCSKETKEDLDEKWCDRN